MFIKLILLVISSVSFSILAQEKIRYFYSSLPPYEYINADNRADGMGIEAIKQLFYQNSPSIEFHFNSINRGIKLLKTGDYDLVSVIAPNEQVQKDFYISNRPLYFVRLGVIRNQSTPSLKDISQLKQQPYVALSSSAFYGLQDKLDTNNTNGMRYNVDSFEQALQLINAGKVDYFLTYDYPSKTSTLSTNVFDGLVSMPVYIAISKHHPNATALVNLVNDKLDNQSTH
ncbi:transporter substrate-binding domain-containing protein [Thalassotalea sp. LPB0316]|uniref:substrate-binding periplasmic protein n=1 Tax=Thalassotalea sp. LPB0316 TaxID=2769490 RepID=UPI0018691583|nr:transporter substrate-binding domain-containing protein [Thalassotalea sp. LPB0316]QOL25678.1 transporter substrate-binding domain-containing protein [Thalassotalea sp. LPB0316]